MAILLAPTVLEFSPFPLPLSLPLFSLSLFLSFRLQEKCQAPSNLLLVLPFAAFTGVQHKTWGLAARKNN